jgi:hypothetical protein
MSISTKGGEAVAGTAYLIHRQDPTEIGMAAQTPVLTMDGELPVEYLMPGDRLITRTGVRRLRQVEVTVLQNARMVMIGQGILGQGRPATELAVRPDQPILIRDWRAKALYGAAQVLVPAARLVDGEFVRAEVVAEMRIFTLLLDEPAVVYAAGVEVLCAGLPVTA